MSEREEQVRQSWVEPEVHVLDIGETAVYPGRGPDAAIYVDCTLS